MKLFSIDFEELIRGLGPRDFARFAKRVTRQSRVMGEVVRLHAEAADWNSPDLERWVDSTEAEAFALRDAGIRTRGAAREWWVRRYAPEAE